MTDGKEGRLVRPSVPVVTTEAQLQDVVHSYAQQPAFSFDIESQGEYRGIALKNDVVWISLATNGRADVIPMGHRNGELIEYRAPLLKSGFERLAAGKPLRTSDVTKADSKMVPIFGPPPPQLSRTTVLDALKPLLLGDQIKIAHNMKFDAVSLAKYLGEPVASPYIDTVVMDWLIDSRLKFQQLKLAQCVERRLGYKMTKGIGEDITQHSFSEVAVYSLRDAKFDWLLWRRQEQILKQHGLTHLINLEMDALEAILHMEMHGTRVDKGAMMVFQAEIEAELETARNKAYKAAGRTFSMTSAAEKIQILFSPEGQNLKPRKFTDKTKAPSTDAEALSHHKRNPVVAAMIEMAEYEKLLSTYIIPYLGGEVERHTAGKTKTVHKKGLLLEGRVHTSFNQSGTETGRLSSSNPNLQNIPSRGRYGKRVRGLFIADPGHMLVVADYSQIEPRIIASLSGDPVMLNVYLTGQDLYQAIADQLGVTRAAGKELILSMSYGVGPDTMSERIGITVGKAKELLDDFERRFPLVQRLKAAVIRQARLQRPPYVTTITGRRRYLPALMSQNFGVLNGAKRQAFNTLIQGSAADIMKIGIVRAHAMVPEQARLLLTVHDELLIQTPDHLAEETRTQLRAAMEGVTLSAMKVPLIADVGVGQTWAQAKADSEVKK